MNDFPPISTEFTKLVASREYELVCNGKSSKIIVEIGAPINDVKTVDSVDWRCPVRIINGDKIINCYGCGVDSFQALDMAMHQTVKVNLEKIIQEKKGKMKLFGSYQLEDFGFMGL